MDSMNATNYVKIAQWIAAYDAKISPKCEILHGGLDPIYMH